MIPYLNNIALIIVASFAVFVVVALEEVCTTDGDCPEGLCYLLGYDENSTGFCMCDGDTNSGCNESKGQLCQVTNFGDSIRGGPSGLHHSCVVPIGYECFQDEDCDTGRCFFLGTNDTHPAEENPAGTCQCRADFNVGCPYSHRRYDGTICTDADVAFGGLPRCAKRMGSQCNDDSECGSRNCFDGLCRCNFNQDAAFWYSGCSNGTHIAIQNTIVDFSITPLDTNTSLLPKGAACFENCQCDTGSCSSAAGRGHENAVCACNYENNAGCPEGYTCTDIYEGDIGVARDCYLAVGSDCPGQMPCMTGTCVDGICHCLASLDFHNYGCPDGQYCVSNDSGTTFWGPAHCEPKKPMGSPCSAPDEMWANECLSNACFNGTCSCKRLSQESGCPPGESCLGPSEEEYWKGPYTCRARSPIGSPCVDFSDCETGLCRDGICQCNTGADWQSIGFCPPDEYCVDSDDGGSSQCTPRTATGFPCNHSGQCIGNADCLHDICQSETYSRHSCGEDPITEPLTASKSMTQPDDESSPSGRVSSSRAATGKAIHQCMITFMAVSFLDASI